MRIELSDAELDYIARLLLARPMGEVEPIVLSIRAQITRQSAGGRIGDSHAEGSSGPQARPNGADEGDGLPLP
jgi:hypothetical protein